jgi:hypothetical protein
MPRIVHVLFYVQGRKFSCLESVHDTNSFMAKIWQKSVHAKYIMIGNRSCKNPFMARKCSRKETVHAKDPLLLRICSF